MSDPRLIDAGKSEKGWSFYGNFRLCMKYGALISLAGYDDKSPPLVKGSLGHTGIAHLHAEWMYTQRKQANPYYSTEEAMHRWCDLHPEGRDYLPLLIETLRRYSAKNPEPPGRRVLAVEHAVKAVLGSLNGIWGLWVVHPDWADWLTEAWREGDPAPYAHVGGQIQISPLNCPGSPLHGGPILLTRRLDLIFEDRAGRVYISDHKFKARVSRSSADEYALDGQFAAARIFGRQMYGERFGDTMLNLVQVGEPWAIMRPPLRPTPWRDEHFAESIWEQAHDIERKKVAQPDVHRWVGAQHEQVCFRRYGGECGLAEVCMHGPGALPARA